MDPPSPFKTLNMRLTRAIETYTVVVNMSTV
jgi:hypothetical protein